VNRDFRVNNAGVPQRSILCPLLFLIFIDDIKEIQLRGTLQLFADDTAIVYSKETWDRLEEAMNNDLGRMKIWMQYNKLLINVM
jgi:hypothetical protein